MKTQPGHDVHRCNPHRYGVWLCSAVVAIAALGPPAGIFGSIALAEHPATHSSGDAAEPGHPSSAPADQPESKSRERPQSRPARAGGTIHGAASLVQRDGATETLAGMQVTVLEADVSRRTMATALEAAASLSEKRAAALQHKADDVRAKFPHLAPNNSPWRAAPPGAPPAPPPDPGKAMADEAAKETARAAAARAAIRTLPDRMSVPDVYKLLGAHSPSAVPDFTDVIKAGKIVTARTDDQGKYTLADIPPGEYFVYAMVISYRAHDWVVPVHVVGEKAVELDLSNK